MYSNTTISEPLSATPVVTNSLNEKSEQQVQPRSNKTSIATPQGFQRVSEDNPCPHCGKPDWCYRLGNLSVCNRDALPAKGWEKTSKCDKEGKYFYAPSQPKKEPRPRGKIEYIYRARDTGQPLAKVTRHDRGDGKKNIYQSHWDGKNWVKGMPPEIKKLIPIYRYAEVREAIEEGKTTVFWVEGEGVADTLWELGLVATTTIGGARKYKSYGDYSGDLEGAEVVILCPDRDKPGLSHMEDINKDYPDAKWLFAPPGDFYWTHLPSGGGLDIADWIAEGVTVEDILAAISDRNIVVEHLQRSYQGEQVTALRHSRSKKKQLLNMLSIQWGAKLRYNEMTLNIELQGEVLDLDCISMRLADEFDIDVGNDAACQALLHLAKQNSYHPVRDYLTSVAKAHPDSEEIQNRLSTIASRYFKTDNPLYDVFMRKTLIAAVNRIFRPGCKHDVSTVLQGKQGWKKSSFWQELCYDQAWFDDTITSGSNDKDERLKLRAYWILELAEIESVFKRKEVSALRGFITTRHDNLRPPYGRTLKSFPRTSAFVGSVNPKQFLVDPEGHRRFWVLPVGGKIPVEMLASERDLLWAAAVHAYRRSEQYWLTEEEEQQNAQLNKQFETTDAWQDLIENWLNGREMTSVGEILADCLKIEPSRQDSCSQKRVTQILKRLDYESDGKQRRINGKKVRPWIKVSQYFTETPTETLTETPQNLDIEVVSEESVSVSQLNCDFVESKETPGHKKNNSPPSSGTPSLNPAETFETVSTPQIAENPMNSEVSGMSQFPEKVTSEKIKTGDIITAKLLPTDGAPRQAKVTKVQETGVWARTEGCEFLVKWENIQKVERRQPEKKWWDKRLDD